MRLLNVRIEPWEEADLPLLVRLNAPEMMEHLGGPETDVQTAARHRRYVETAQSDTAFVFKILLDPGEQAAGQVTFWERIWHDESVYEMGWGRPGAGSGARDGTAEVSACLSLGGQCGLERPVSQARLRASWRNRCRISARTHHAVQRLAVRSCRCGA
jgi:hypothetical protein